SPAAAGVKEKRFSTVKSQVLFGLRHLGLAGKGTYLTPMKGEWARMWRKLTNKYDKTAFSRFFRYGSAQGLSPGDVDDAVTREFMPRGEGLGRKNRLRLAPLRDPENLVRLFLLPGKICKEIEAKKKVLRDDALLMQLAVALSVLTYTPLRIGNLSALH